MQTWYIPKLRSGGVITNYLCLSRCRHCLYNCSPQREKDYLKPDRAEKIFRIIHQSGCRNVHIGGGEPLLQSAKLQAVLRSANKMGVVIDYVETNAAWFKDNRRAVDILAALKQCGLKSLLISISPFHNEFIPFAKTLGLLEACENVGLNVIAWVGEFIPILSRLKRDTPNHMDALRAVYADEPLSAVRKRYWIHMGGRALDTYRPHLPLMTYEEIIDRNTHGCLSELTSTDHFHIDLYGQYIPGLCAGLALPMTAIGHHLHSRQYPILSRLALKGIGALLEWASNHYDFRPQRKGYVNKCDLCTEVRQHIAMGNKGPGFSELHPVSFYKELDPCP